MAKFCGNCGSELIEGARACGNCGTFVDGSVNIYTENNNVANNNVVNDSSNNTIPNGNTFNNTNNVVSNHGADYGTIGFVISLISTFVCCGTFNIISFILCLIGLLESKKNPNINKTLSIAGLIISSAGVFLFFGVMVLRVFFSILQF